MTALAGWRLLEAFFHGGIVFYRISKFISRLTARYFNHHKDHDWLIFGHQIQAHNLPAAVSR